MGFFEGIQIGVVSAHCGAESASRCRVEAVAQVIARRFLFALNRAWAG
ncbi:MAG: hypothetical protein WBK77_10855 [Alphaproteobacteria bacterium]